MLLSALSFDGDVSIETPGDMLRAPAPPNVTAANDKTERKEGNDGETCIPCTRCTALFT